MKDVMTDAKGSVGVASVMASTTKALSSPLSEWEEGDAIFMAPELLNDAHPTSAADIFSMGVTLFQLCTNVRLQRDDPLFSALRSSRLTASMALATFQRWPLANSVVTLITNCLSPSAADRPTAETLVSWVHLTRPRSA